MGEPVIHQSAFHASRATTELYRACMNLSEEARSLLVRNEGMKRLGLNAQVLAAQTGSQGRALEVIVSDIGRLSIAIRDILGALGESAKTLSGTSIEMLHLAHLKAGYDKGLARGIRSANRALYSKAHACIRSRAKRHRLDLKERLRTVSGQVEDLGRIAQQILPVTTMIRIVVVDATSKAGELLGAVDELKSFHADLDAKVERMRDIREICFQYIQAMDKEDR